METKQAILTVETIISLSRVKPKGKNVRGLFLSRVNPRCTKPPYTNTIKGNDDWFQIMSCASGPKEILGYHVRKNVH